MAYQRETLKTNVRKKKEKDAQALTLFSLPIMLFSYDHELHQLYYQSCRIIMLSRIATKSKWHVFISSDCKVMHSNYIQEQHVYYCLTNYHCFCTNKANASNCGWVYIVTKPFVTYWAVGENNIPAFTCTYSKYAGIIPFAFQYLTCSYSRQHNLSRPKGCH